MPYSPELSKTALYVAAGRAIGAREPDPLVRNPDFLAERLIGDPGRLGVDLAALHALSLDYEEAMEDLEVVNNVRAMIVRTRFIDEALERAIRRGVRQLVVLGAGFDSHAHRCRELLSGVEVYEVDRPRMQAYKRERVDAVLGGAPGNLHYVAVEFGRDDLAEALANAGFDRELGAFFILEGLTMYVAEPAMRETFRLIASQRTPTSLAFDFVPSTLISSIAGMTTPVNLAAGTSPALGRFLSLIVDEPWVFGLPAGEEGDYLAELGLEILETLPIGGEESIRRYLTRADGSAVGEAALAAAAADAASSPMVRRWLEERRHSTVYQIAEARIPVRH